MNFVRIGRRLINLDHVLVIEECESGGTRVHMGRGRVVDLDEQETADLWAALDWPTPPDEPGQDPATGSWRDRPPML